MENLNEMVGKRLLVGITYVDQSGEVQDSVEFAGIVISVEPYVSIERGDGEKPFTLPPAPDAYSVADAGEYTLRSTGEVVENPDYLTSWTVGAQANEEGED